MQTTTMPPVAGSAPPRRRRRWKIFGGIALFLLAIPVAWYLFAGWYANRQLETLYHELDADDPNWRWPDLVAELNAGVREPNSATQVIKVSGFLRKAAFNPGGKWYSDSTDKALQMRNARLSEERVQLLRTAFGALDPACLDEARKLKDMPGGRFMIETGVENPFEMQIEYIQRTREVMNLLAADVILRAQDDDFEGAADSCRALLHAAGAIDQHPTLVAQLVRIAGQSMAIAALERLLAQGSHSEERLLALQSALAREAGANLLYYGMRGERAGGHQFFMAVRNGKTSLGDFLGSMGRGGGVRIEERLLDMFPGILLQGHPKFLRLMHENVKASKLDYPERAEALGKLETKIRASKTLAVRLFMPASTKVSEAAQRSQALLRCASTAVAAERYRLKHQNWPAGLKDLVADGLLKEIPKDPYDGQPLRWRLTPNGGALVYSVGPDKIDDGGNLSRANPQAKGIDYGFELWSPRDRAGPPPAEAEKLGD
jgi:competence protein ComGC